MKIPYSLPLIDKSVIDEVNDALYNVGWLTSGPKVREFEIEISNLTNCKHVACVNSWTSGAMLVLRWFGVGKGDEVIIPSYTYSATALSVLNIGAVPIMVDVNDDFNINIDLISNLITNKTKAIIPVDIAGWPCDYNELNNLINSNEIKRRFTPNNDKQKRLNRILLISDAAHSIGAKYEKNQIGNFADFTIFSFHSVKNITTGEGGAICVNLPSQFDNNYEHKLLKALSLNGQTKSAFEKNQIGGWRYDILDQGLKVNMPDICAAIGLAQIKKYNSVLLPERKKIFKFYNEFFRKKQWAIIPNSKNSIKESSYHLYLLRIDSITEHQRDEIISIISKNGIGVNVHYIPMPMLTLFKNLGYKIEDYPNTYKLFSNEITLPVYNGLSPEKLEKVCEVVENAFKIIVKQRK